MNKQSNASRAIVAELIMRSFNLLPSLTKNIGSQEDLKALVDTVLENYTINIDAATQLGMAAEAFAALEGIDATSHRAQVLTAQIDDCLNDMSTAVATHVSAGVTFMRTDIYDTTEVITRMVESALSEATEDVKAEDGFAIFTWGKLADTSMVFAAQQAAREIGVNLDNKDIGDLAAIFRNVPSFLPPMGLGWSSEDETKFVNKAVELGVDESAASIIADHRRLRTFTNRFMDMAAQRSYGQFFNFVKDDLVAMADGLMLLRDADLSDMKNADELAGRIHNLLSAVHLMHAAVALVRNTLFKESIAIPCSEGFMINDDGINTLGTAVGSIEAATDLAMQAIEWTGVSEGRKVTARTGGLNTGRVIRQKDVITAEIAKKRAQDEAQKLSAEKRAVQLSLRRSLTRWLESMPDTGLRQHQIDEILEHAGTRATMENGSIDTAIRDALVALHNNKSLTTLYKATMSGLKAALESADAAPEKVRDVALCKGVAEVIASSFGNKK